MELGRVRVSHVGRLRFAFRRLLATKRSKVAVGQMQLITKATVDIQQAVRIRS